MVVFNSPSRRSSAFNALYEKWKFRLIGKRSRTIYVHIGADLWILFIWMEFVWEQIHMSWENISRDIDMMAIHSNKNGDWLLQIKPPNGVARLACSRRYPVHDSYISLLFDTATLTWAERIFRQCQWKQNSASNMGSYKTSLTRKMHIHTLVDDNFVIHLVCMYCIYA